MITYSKQFSYEYLTKYRVYVVNIRPKIKNKIYKEVFNEFIQFNGKLPNILNYVTFRFVIDYKFKKKEQQDFETKATLADKAIDFAKIYKLKYKKLKPEIKQLHETIKKIYIPKIKKEWDNIDKKYANDYEQLYKEHEDAFKNSRKVHI